jgi:hypothetical protein
MGQKEIKKQEAKRKPFPNEKAFDTDEIGVNIANTYLPDIMRLRKEDGEIRLYLYVNTGVTDKEGNAINDWKNIHVQYDGQNRKDFLLGFIKGIETLANYERLLKIQMEQSAFEEQVKISGKENELHK